MLDERKLAVLRATIHDYVASREPVGSKGLVERHGLDVSPATVRNDMAVLEEEGYLVQPHTSAGRIPTDKGYRLFVDRLVTLRPLTPPQRRAIETFLAGAVDKDDIVRRTVRLLAQLTRQVAMVQYPVSDQTFIKHVELVALEHDRALLVLIDSAGNVEQRLLHPGSIDEQRLTQIRDLLNATLVGAPTSNARQALAVLSVDGNMPADLAVFVKALDDLLDPGQPAQVVVAGMPNLARFGAEYATTIKPVLEALEEQVVLLTLLGEAVANPGEVAVRIGQENPFENLQTTSLVASTYGSPSDGFATLGVVGPTHMDYPSTIAAVRAVARYVGQYLAEG